MILNSISLQWITLFLLFWVITLSVLVFQSLWHYRRLTKNVSKKDLKTVLTQVLDKLELDQKEISGINKELAKIKLDLAASMQKIGFIRFNPFMQTGGDQSFCLALLDKRNNGLILSSLHSRESTRIYAKTVKNGQSEGYELSKEEERAIQSAK